jgi:hypothetical protein
VIGKLIEAAVDIGLAVWDLVATWRASSAEERAKIEAEVFATRDRLVSARKSARDSVAARDVETQAIIDAEKAKQGAQAIGLVKSATGLLGDDGKDAP